MDEKKSPIIQARRSPSLMSKESHVFSLLVRPRFNQSLINKRKMKTRLVKAEGMHYWEREISRERKK